MVDQTELKRIADAVVAANHAGDVSDLFENYYHADCVSVEGMAMEGGPGREAKGMDAIRAKGEWWDENHEMHDATTEGPFLHGENQFAVIYGIDVTTKATGERMQMREVGLYTVEGGKIIKEEFFY
ncbi:MAG: nuclear transport factor 2 family protein [Pseudomonadota bacterium]